MADFHQATMISTLHRLKKGNYQQLETDLLKFKNIRPIALVLPALFSDLKTETAQKIITILKEVKYLNEIILTLGKANKQEYLTAKEILNQLPHPNKKIIWNDGEKIQKLYKTLEGNGLTMIEDGKGRSAWISYGYVLASGKSEVIVLHDCDVITYNREFLARLCYPVGNPNLGYEFCKGFYSRVSNKLNGRVTRLFVFPLVRALKKILGNLPFLEFIDNFRYPLAGEFSMVASLARVNRIPYDWGLEVGVLAEIFRNVSPRRVCQVELCDNYDHKHQLLIYDNSQTGLLKMAIDIAKSIFRTLASEGVVFSEGFFKTLRVAYVRIAQDMIKNYNDDALIDSLTFDRHEEGSAVESFSKGIKIAAEEFFKDPLGIPLIPNWNRVTSAIPDFFEKLYAAVEEDSK